MEAPCRPGKFMSIHFLLSFSEQLYFYYQSILRADLHAIDSLALDVLNKVEKSESQNITAESFQEIITATFVSSVCQSIDLQPTFNRLSSTFIKIYLMFCACCVADNSFQWWKANWIERFLFVLLLFLRFSQKVTTSPCLLENGADIPVSWENRKEFVKLVEEYRYCHSPWQQTLQPPLTSLQPPSTTQFINFNITSTTFNNTVH